MSGASAWPASTFSPSMYSSTSTRSVTYGRITCGTTMPVVLLDEPRDQLGVVRLLDEVELAAQVHLELVGERLDLKQLRRLRAPCQELRRRAQHREVELDLLDDARAAAP